MTKTLMLLCLLSAPFALAADPSARVPEKKTATLSVLRASPRKSAPVGTTNNVLGTGTADTGLPTRGAPTTAPSQSPGK